MSFDRQRKNATVAHVVFVSSLRLHMSTGRQLYGCICLSVDNVNIDRICLVVDSVKVGYVYK